LTGFYPHGQNLELVSEAKKQDFFHLKIIDNTRPDYLQTVSDKNIIEAKFISLLDDLKSKAEAEGGFKSSEKSRVVNDALYYGLEAIREGRVTIRHAD